MNLTFVENKKFGTALKANLAQTNIILNLFTDINSFEQMILKKLTENGFHLLSFGIMYTAFDVARDTLKVMQDEKNSVILVTGNSLHKVSDFGFSELDVLQWIVSIFTEIKKKNPSIEVISDGMDGIGILTLTACRILDIPFKGTSYCTDDINDEDALNKISEKINEFIKLIKT